MPKSNQKKKTAVKKKQRSEKSKKSKEKTKAIKPKAKAPAKARAKKAAAPKKGKVTIKALLSKRFDTGVMDKLAAQSPYKAKESVKIPESPPFVSGPSRKQVEQVRALLFKSFDLKEKAPAKKSKAGKAKAAAATKAKASAKAKAPAKAKARTAAKAKAPAKARAKKAAAPKKGKVTIKALLSKRFDTGVMDKLAAQSPYKAKESVKIPESPPFVSGRSRKQVEQVRALLFRAFDLTALPEGEASGDIVPVEEAFQAPVTPAVLSQPKESAGLAVKLGLSGLAILMAIVIATSLSNRRSFFLKEVGGTLEVWQGKFAPTGSELILSLEGMKLPNPIRDVYSKSEVYRLAFDHYEGKADALLYDSMEPDFSKINTYLRQAATYAPTGVERTMAQRRLDSMALLILLHRVDVALIKGTLPDLEAARASLEKGTGYISSEYQRDLIAKRKAVLDSAIAQLSK